MEVHLSPDVQVRLDQLARETGRARDEFVQEAIAAYLRDLAHVGEMLDSRYDDAKTGKVKLIDGEAFFDSLREREDELLKPRPAK